MHVQFLVRKLSGANVHCSRTFESSHCLKTGATIPTKNKSNMPDTDYEDISTVRGGRPMTSDEGDY